MFYVNLVTSGVKYFPLYYWMLYVISGFIILGQEKITDKDGLRFNLLATLKYILFCPYL
jgi:hypothetical protein